MIEDSQVDRLVLRSHLEAHGVRVTHTDSAITALELLELGHFDAVVCDVILPGISGLELLKKLRSLIPGLPVLMVTASSKAGPAVEAMRMGAADYLVKPVSQDALVTGVITAVRGRGGRLEAPPPDRAAGPSHEARSTGRAILEQIPDGILLADDQGQVLFVNGPGREILGPQSQSIGGRPVTMLQDFPEFVAFVTQAVIGLETADSRLVRVPGTSGAERTLACTARKLSPAGAGTSPVTLIHFLDSSRHARLEAAMLKADKLASLGLMAGALAHEINNPLSVVLGTLGFLLEDLGDTNHEVTDRLRIVERNTWKCVDIVRHFLKLSRSGTGELHAVLIDRLLDDILALLSKNLAVHGIRVEREIERNLPGIMGSETQLQQVLLNLVLNARDAMEKGGTLTLRARRAGDQVIIEVADTGPGVAPQLRDRVFENFFTTKAPGKGTGLGLAICKALVEEHRGTLELVCPERGGATFRMKFPAADSGEVTCGEIMRVSGEPKMQTFDLDVLAVDDEEGILEIYRVALSRAGCRAAFYTNPELALREFVAGCFDLAILDLRMPQMDGFELCRRLLAIDSGLPVIFVSGTLMTEDDSQIEAAGAKGYVSKPFRVEELNGWLELAARTRRARRGMPYRQPLVPDRQWRVLIVDDDEDVSFILRKGLETAGKFEVVQAADGVEGLQRALDTPPDLILLDIMMPGLDGLEVCRRLRADARTATVPVVIHSVKMQIHDVLKAMQAGANHYLMKPMEIGALTRELLELLERPPLVSTGSPPN
ncbi:MAG: response regulator [Candidatus Wallbacteria bacterium]|nr:response regulator [Candidatus Wallbacteria bacterium]